MQIIEELKDFFGLEFIADAQTFPDLLQAIVYIFLACALLLFMFRAFFAMNAAISKGGK